MTSTFCLGSFAKRLSALPLTNAAWREAIEQQPETCPKGCKAHCRAVCREYATVQRQAISHRKEPTR